MIVTDKPDKCKTGLNTEKGIILSSGDLSSQTGKFALVLVGSGIRQECMHSLLKNPSVLHE